MRITIQETIGSADLDFDTLQSIESQVKQQITDDEGVMEEIKELVKEENSDGLGKLSLQDYINLKVDDLVSDAVSKVKIYIDFDVEVEVK